MLPNVSLCMIVKDEERFIQNSLASAKPYVDDMVVVDTGSVDNTKQIAAAGGARVFDFTWCDDFSAARNYAAAQAFHDWILVLDADEEITDVESETVLQMMKDITLCGCAKLLELTNDYFSQVARLYNKTHSQYSGTIHEQIVPINPKTKINELRVPIRFKHYGYLPDVMQEKKKFERNKRMLLRELKNKPNDPYLLYQLGKSHFAADDTQKACDYFSRALANLPTLRLSYAYTLVEGYGYALINTQQHKKALEHVQRYEANYQANPDFRFMAAHVKSQNGMLIEAVELYESCIGDTSANNPEVTTCLSYYNIGVILECVGMTDDAIKTYTQCGEYEPALARLRELS